MRCSHITAWSCVCVWSSVVIMSEVSGVCVCVCVYMPCRTFMCIVRSIYSLHQPPRSLYYNKELMKRTLGRPTYAFEARQYVVSVCVCVGARGGERGGVWGSG